MIKNIGNSFIGGFFRRLGSIFALFFILALIGYLLKDLDTDSFVNKLLGIQKVNASSSSVVLNQNNPVTTSNFNCSGTAPTQHYPLRNFYGYEQVTNTSLLSFNYWQFNCGSTKYINIPSNSQYLNILLYVKTNLDMTILYDVNTSNTYESKNYMSFLVTSISSSTNSGRNWFACQFVSNVGDYYYIKCPLAKNDTRLEGFRINYNYNYATTNLVQPNNFTLYFGFYDVINIDLSDNDMINQMQILNNTQQQTNNKLDETNNKLQQTNDTLNSSNTTEAESEAGDLFTNTQYESHGITGIITAPLNLIQSLVSKSCSPLVLPLPFIDEDLTLPCLSSVYSQNFPSFLTIYQIIISALIGYRICVSVFFMVKDFKNPDSDKIEVLDL